MGNAVSGIVGSLFGTPAKYLSDGMIDAASVASENISRGMDNAADVSSQNVSIGMQNSTKVWSQAWSSTCRYAVDSTFIALPKASRDLFYNAAVAWGDAWNQSVQNVCSVGERTARDVIPPSSKILLSDAASKLSDAWMRSTANMGRVMETAGVSMSEKFCQNAAEHFQNALVTVSADMKTTLPHAFQLFMHNASANLSKALLTSTKMVLDSSEVTLPEMAQKLLLDAAEVWSDACRDAIPRAAQLHLKDAFVELKQGMIVSAVVASVAYIIASIICNNNLLSTIFGYIRPFILVAFLLAIFYKQQMKVMQICYSLIKENQAISKEVDQLRALVAKLLPQNEELRSKFETIEEKVPFLMSSNNLPYSFGDEKGFQWFTFSNLPRAERTELFLNSVSTYEIYMKWNVMELKSDIASVHAYQTFHARSPKITIYEDSLVYWNLALKQVSENVSLHFSLNNLKEEENLVRLRRKVVLKSFIYSTNYGDIVNREDECDCECFPFGENKKQFSLNIENFIGLKELKKYIEKGNDLTLVIYASVWKLP